MKIWLMCYLQHALREYSNSFSAQEKKGSRQVLCLHEDSIHMYVKYLTKTLEKSTLEWHKIAFSSVPYSSFVRCGYKPHECASVFACVNNKYFETVATVRKHNWPYRLKISHSYRTKKCKHCAKCLFALWAKAKISIHWLSEKVIQKTHKNVLCFIFDLKLVQRQ